jgi:hypothetical protein
MLRETKLQIALFVGSLSLCACANERPAASPEQRKQSNQAIMSVYPKITECYQRAVEKDNTLAGFLRMQLFIDPDGSLNKVVDVEHSSKRTAALLGCIQAVLQPLSYPVSPDGFRYNLQVQMILDDK